MNNNLVSAVIMFLIGAAVFLAGWFVRRLVDRSKIAKPKVQCRFTIRNSQREA